MISHIPSKFIALHTHLQSAHVVHSDSSRLNFLPRTHNRCTEDVLCIGSCTPAAETSRLLRSKTNVLISCVYAGAHMNMNGGDRSLYFPSLYSIITRCQREDPVMSASPTTHPTQRAPLLIIHKNLFRFFDSEELKEKNRVCVWEDEKINPPPPRRSIIKSVSNCSTQWCSFSLPRECFCLIAPPCFTVFIARGASSRIEFTYVSVPPPPPRRAIRDLSYRVLFFAFGAERWKNYNRNIFSCTHSGGMREWGWTNGSFFFIIPLCR